MLMYVVHSALPGAGVGWSSAGHWWDWAGGRQQLGPAFPVACLPASSDSLDALSGVVSTQMLLLITHYIPPIFCVR